MRRNRTTVRRLASIAALALCAALLLAGCGGGRDNGFVDRNEPYEPDTPAPAPHDGVFVSDHGTMTFSGDGKTVQIDFDEDLAGRLGLPAGPQAAAYVFRSGYLAPHGYVDVRYDAAMTFWLTVGEGDGAASAMVEVGRYEDGNFYSGVGCVTPERITFFVETAPDGGDWEPVDFVKSEPR